MTRTQRLLTIAFIVAVFSAAFIAAVLDDRPIGGLKGYLTSAPSHGGAS